MKLIMFMPVALGFLIMVSPNYAAAGTESANPVFQIMDSNKNGKIEHDEFVQDMKINAFSKIDHDGDSIITWTQWNSIDNVKDRKKHEELFKSIDKNNDNKLSILEFADYSEEHSNVEDSFITLDSNKNGSLSPDEIWKRPAFRLFTIRF